MEDTLWLDIIDSEGNVIKVLILVLMEDTLWRTYAGSTK